MKEFLGNMNAKSFVAFLIAEALGSVGFFRLGRPEDLVSFYGFQTALLGFVIYRSIQSDKTPTPPGV